MPTEPNKPQVNELYGTRFVKLYDLVYDDGSHYFEASRRSADDLLAMADAEALGHALPDAVSACLIVEVAGDEPRMVLNYEYRYPTGQYVMGIPSGLVDARDLAQDDPLVASMTREIAEETGIRLGEEDRIWVANRLLYNTPGLTDESTALLCAVAHLDDYSALSHDGAEGSERFGSFELLTKAQALEVLTRGVDPRGRFYPMVTWAALAYFACDLWKAQN